MALPVILAEVLLQRKMRILIKRYRLWVKYIKCGIGKYEKFEIPLILKGVWSG
jgi:hypothetical protein